MSILMTRIVAVALVGFGFHADAAESVSAMQTRGLTSPPIGFVQFCRKNLSDCVGLSSGAARVVLTSSRWGELVEINSNVNRAIEPMTDEELYGVQENWTYPAGGKGDCEDYVLQKRKMLVARGWPVTSLLITVVRDAKNEWHAVLTVVTHRGDFVLDNQNPQVLPWNRTEYRFVKRQSAMDVSRWESIEDHRAQVIAATR